MNCIDFELAVQAQLDARRTELPAELQPHHDDCADCRSFYATQRALVATASEWRRTPAPERITDAVLTELAVPLTQRPTGVMRSRSRERLVAALCSAAAIVMLAVALLRAPPAGPQPVARQTPAASPVESAVVSDTLTGLLHGMNADLAALPAHTEQALRHIGELPDSAPLLPELSDPDRPTLEPPVEWRRWDRPVSDRVGQAFGFLWDALPQTSERSS